MDQLKAVKEAVNHVYWSLVVQGVAFVLLAILIVLYPPLLIALASATFLVVGVMLLVLAWKLRKLWDKMPSILK